VPWKRFTFSEEENMTKKDEPAEVKTAKINMLGTVLVALFALVSTLAGLYFNAQHNKQVAAAKPEKITYSGRILDASNGQPVVGAAVSIDVEGAPPAVYTDSDGVYQFDVTLDTSKTGQIKVELKRLPALYAEHQALSRQWNVSRYSAHATDAYSYTANLTLIYFHTGANDHVYTGSTSYQYATTQNTGRWLYLLANLGSGFN
jgi:hypothetical protein